MMRASTGVSKTKGPSLGVSIIRIIVYCSLLWAPHFWEAPKQFLVGL